jgi:hypothetical protein
VLWISAQQVIHRGATYDVTDANGTPIGVFRTGRPAFSVTRNWGLRDSTW